MSNLFQNIGLWTSIIGFFSIFDMIIEDKRRNQISEYIFGFKEISTANFESHMIKSLISAYIKNDRLNWKRIFLFYTVSGGIILLLMTIFIFADPRPTVLELKMPVLEFFGMLFVSILFCICSLPFDYISVRISKRIFYDKSKPFPISVIWIFIDGALSLIAPAILMSVMLLLTTGDTPIISNEMIYGDNAQIILAFVTATIIITGFTSLFLSFIQFIILVLGIMIRGLLKWSKLNMYLVQFSKIHENPFSFIGIIVGGLFVFGNAIF